MKYFITIVTCLFLAQSAMADKEEAQSQGQAQGQGQEQTAIVGSTASAGSSSDSVSQSSGIGSGVASSDSYGAGGNAGASVESGDYSAWALSIPGATSAPAVALECMTHTSGWSLGPVFSKSGKTKYDVDCVAFSQCIVIAGAYAQMGEKRLALDKLSTCSPPALEQ